jgi:hypothetical protein
MAKQSTLTYVLQARIDKLEAGLNRANGKLSSFNRKTAAANSKLESSFSSTFNKIGGIMAGAFALSRVADFTMEVVKLGGEALGVEAAFGRLENSTQVLEDLKEATGGTVSELELMKKTVQAANFGISLKALPDLLEFATLRAQQTGQSVDYLVDSIVTGIGRKSPLILDNLGISAVALKEELGGVSMAAADVGTVAEAVGRIAARELEGMAGFSENAATKQQRLTATWDNLKVKLGEIATPLAGVFDLMTKGLDSVMMQMSVLQGTYGEFKVEGVKAFGDIEEAVENLDKKLKGNTQDRKWVGKFSEDIEDALTSLQKKGGETTETLRRDFEVLKGKIQQYSEDIESSEYLTDEQRARSLDALAGAYNKITEILKRKTQAEIDAAKAGEDSNDVTIISIVNLESLNEKLTALKSQKMTALSGQIAGIDRQIDALNNKIENFGYGERKEKTNKAPVIKRKEMSDVGFGVSTAEIKLVEANYEYLNKAAWDFKSEQARIFTEMQQDIQSIMQMIATDMIAGLVINITSGKKPFSGIMDILGDGLIQLGKFLIIHSEVMKGIKAALANPFGAGGFALGIVAITAGAALKQSAANANKGMAGGGGGGGNRGSIGSSQSLNGQSIKVTGEFIASGKDLKLVLNKYDSINSRSKSRG